MERIGFIGLGLMGHGMAKNLLAKGYPLTFKAHRNRSNLADLLAAGAKEVPTLADVGAASDIVFLCVTGSPQVEAVMSGGLREASRRGQLIVDCSTAEPDSTTRLRAACAERGVTLTEAGLLMLPILAACDKSSDLRYQDLPQGDAVNGAALFTQSLNDAPPCSACHSLGDESSNGPGLGNYAERAAERVDNLSAGEYTLRSIVHPAAYIVNGYSNIMYSRYEEALSQQELADLIAYLLSLGSE